MNIATLLIAALAVWEVLEIWRHSHLFSGPRAYVEALDDWRGYFLRCMFCLAPWTALVVLLAIWLGALTARHWGWLGDLLVLPIYALAVARLANVMNDMTSGFCRTPRADRLELPDDADTEG
jgi:hypothetical protein